MTYQDLKIQIRIQNLIYWYFMSREEKRKMEGKDD